MTSINHVGLSAFNYFPVYVQKRLSNPIHIIDEVGELNLPLTIC